MGTPATRPAPTAAARDGQVVDYRYTMTARVRPLLFWIPFEEVGGGRVVLTTEANGGERVELLIGSDPDRAPLRVNRWGYLRETVTAGRADLLGVMSESEEESPDDALSSASGAPPVARVFRAIRSSVADGEAVSAVSRLTVPGDPTFRDADALLVQLRFEDAVSRRVPVPPMTELGFLTAVRGLLREHVARYQQSRRLGGLSGGHRTFVYDATLYDLTARASRLVPDLAAAHRSFQDVVDTEFETRNRRTGNTECFRIAYPAVGPEAGMPIRIVHRPRWWFEAELLLTDQVRRPAQQSARSAGL